jgi:hypothetical protein
MNLSLLVALVEDGRAEDVITAARDAGATGATIIQGARGEGLEKEKTFLGLSVTSQREMILFLVAKPRARRILEKIAEAGEFDETPGTGVAFELEILDAVGLGSQLKAILSEIERDI